MLNDAVTEQPLSLGAAGSMYPVDPDNNLEEPKAMAQYDKAYREAEAYPHRMLKSQLYTDPGTHAYTCLLYFRVGNPACGAVVHPFV